MTGAVADALSDAIADELGRAGRCVHANFLSPDELRELRGDLDDFHGAGAFHRAGTGQGTALKVHDLVRRDEIYWLEPAIANGVQAALLARLEALRVSFNRRLFLGLDGFEGHYALYPPGGYYRRHLDTFRGDPARMVSLILYLNRDWRGADGGELWIYGKDGAPHRAIEPVGGTLVCFLSQEAEHEVRVSYRARASFAGWFKRKLALSAGSSD